MPTTMQTQADLLKELARPFDATDMVAMRKCLCGKLLAVNETKLRWYSGVINYDESLCRECRKECADLARIVCLGCRSLQGFLKPQTAKTGFKFEGRRHYHLQKCPRCAPTLMATPVLEHEAYCRDRKIVTTKNLDLVQEIEQKTLQGVSEANRLREELNSSRHP